MLITEVRRGVGGLVQREGASGCSNKASVAGGSRESTQRINVVNENETNWTRFCLIMHPAQVKRSEVQKNTCATSKPVGPQLLIDTSEEGGREHFQR